MAVKIQPIPAPGFATQEEVVAWLKQQGEGIAFRGTRPGDPQQWDIYAGEVENPNLLYPIVAIVTKGNDQ